MSLIYPGLRGFLFFSLSNFIRDVAVVVVFFFSLSFSDLLFLLNRRKKQNIIHFLGLPQLAHMVDLHLFLGRPLKLAGKDSRAQDDGLIGSVPQLLVDEEDNFLKRAHDQSHDLVSLMIW